MRTILRRTLLGLACTLLATAAAHAQQSDNYRSLLRNRSVKIDGTNLPIVFINTSNRMIQKDNYILARMKIVWNGEGQTTYGDTLAHRDQQADYDGFVALKYRGNSSFYNADKKPYAFRTLESNVLPADGGKKQKTKILGMGKDNKWAFIAPWADEVMFRDLLSFELGRPWFDFTPQGRLCEVILDGTYYGVYVICERVSKGKKRLNLEDPGTRDGDLTGDFLVEIDRPDQAYYQSPYRPWRSMDGSQLNYNYSVLYQYKAPEEDDFAELPAGTRQAINNEIAKMENAFMADNWLDPSEGYRKYIDVTSFIDYMLSTEVSMNIDGYRLSTNYYKYSHNRAQEEGLDDRWKMALWDFNIAWGNANYYNGDQTGTWQYTFNLRETNDDRQMPFYWYKMLQDPDYTQAMKERWQEYRAANYSDERLFATVDSLANLLTANGAADRNEQAWGVFTKNYIWPLPYYARSYSDAVSHMKSWITQRLAFMDKSLSLPRDIVTRPIAVKSGWNADVVAETTPAGSTTSTTVDSADRAFYSASLKADGGLPADRNLVSANENVRYQLSPYDADNALTLKSSGSYGKVEFETPVHTSELFILATSGNGAGNITLTLNYEGGAMTGAGSHDVRDWSVRSNQLQGDEAVKALGNIGRSNNAVSSDNHYCLFDFSVPVDPDRALKSVTIRSNNSSYVSVLAFSQLVDTTEGVETLRAVGDKATVIGIYNLNGMRLNELQKGVNIVKFSDGTTRKLLVR